MVYYTFVLTEKEKHSFERIGYDLVCANAKCGKRLQVGETVVKKTVWRIERFKHADLPYGTETPRLKYDFFHEDCFEECFLVA